MDSRSTDSRLTDSRLAETRLTERHLTDSRCLHSSSRWMLPTTAKQTRSCAKLQRRNECACGRSPMLTYFMQRIFICTLAHTHIECVCVCIGAAREQFTHSAFQHLNMSSAPRGLCPWRHVHNSGLYLGRRSPSVTRTRSFKRSGNSFDNPKIL